MRTHSTNKPTGNDGETTFHTRQHERSNLELQFFDSSTVKVEQTTRGVRWHAKIPPASSSPKQSDTSFKGIYTPGTYNTFDEVLIQAGPGQGMYICLADGNTNAPTTGINWVQVSSLNQWF